MGWRGWSKFEEAEVIISKYLKTHSHEVTRYLCCGVYLVRRIIVRQASGSAQSLQWPKPDLIRARTAHRLRLAFEALIMPNGTTGLKMNV